MDWQPMKTAPSRMRVLICDDVGRVQIGRAAGLRWYDDAGHLLAVLLLRWMPLPEGRQTGSPLATADLKFSIGG
jgi:hypothetical protein